MPARDWRTLAGILLLSAAPLYASSQLEADPHDLYEAARSHLRNGELQAAEASLTQLRSLVAPGSRWDPDGVFAKELLPPLSAKLRRMQAVARELDAFCADALADLRPPEGKDGSALHDYAVWATSQIESLRERRDRILTSKLADADERAALVRTTSYACTERLLETDVLKSLGTLPDTDLSGVVSGDPRVDPILVRFRQLKQDLMTAIAERDQLRKDKKESKVREAAFLKALADITTGGALPGPPSGGSRAKTASDRFGTFLAEELESANRQSTQTSADLEAREADLGRYRRYNALILQAGLGEDQSPRIKELERAVEGIRVDDRLRRRPFAAWRSPIVSALLGLIAGAFCSMMLLRRQRPSSLRSVSPRPPIQTATTSRSVDDHAA